MQRELYRREQIVKREANQYYGRQRFIRFHRWGCGLDRVLFFV